MAIKVGDRVRCVFRGEDWTGTVREAGVVNFGDVWASVERDVPETKSIAAGNSILPGVIVSREEYVPERFCRPVIDNQPQPPLSTGSGA